MGTEKTLREELGDMDDRRAVDDDDAGRGTFLPADQVRRILDGASPLRVYREHRGLTLQALADRIGVGKSYLSQIETARRPARWRSCATAPPPWTWTWTTWSEPPYPAAMAASLPIRCSTPASRDSGSSQARP